MISEIEIHPRSGDFVEVSVFISSVGSSVDAKVEHHDTQLRVVCKSIHLEDPARPGVRIDT